MINLFEKLKRCKVGNILICSFVISMFTFATELPAQEATHSKAHIVKDAPQKSYYHQVKTNSPRATIKTFLELR